MKIAKIKDFISGQRDLYLTKLKEKPCNIAIETFLIPLFDKMFLQL